MIGQVFGRLTVTDRGGLTAAQKRLWICRCECGGSAVPTTGALRSGNTKSCGCYNAEMTGNAGRLRIKHGLLKSPTYSSWQAMKSRCLCPADPFFKRYGGKGISVCDAWAASFEAFYADMGLRPSREYSLDRIDNALGYYKDNCRWATREEQQRNTSKNVRLTFDGRTLTVVEWAELKGWKAFTLYKRVEQGWPVERILTEAPFFGRRSPFIRASK